MSRPATRRIPFVQQLAASDCGAACLAMVLAHFGHRRRIASLSDAIGSSADGVRLASLAEVAPRFGLRAHAVRLPPEGVDELPAATVLHWRGNHFVVFERTEPDHVVVLDPAVGRRRLTRTELAAGFSGTGVVFERGPDFETGDFRGSRWRPLRALLKSHRRPLLTVAALSLGLAVLGAALPLVVQVAIDGILPRSDLAQAHQLGLALLGLVVVQLLLSLGRARVLAAMVVRIEGRLSVRFMEGLARISIPMAHARSHGDLLTRVGSHADVRALVTSGAVSALLDGALASSYLVALLVLSPSMGLLVLGLLAGYGLLTAVVVPRARRLSAEEVLTRSAAAQRSLELVSGLEAIRAMGLEQDTVSRWRECYDTALEATHQRERFDGFADACLGALRFGAPLALVWIGIWDVLEGTSTPGAMLALLTFALGFFGHSVALAQMLLRLPRLGTLLERIEDISEAPAEPGGLCRDRLRGRIELRGVDFRYDPRGPPVLRDIDLRIESGELVAVVGATGAGKSTLIRLLTGLYPVTAGEVLFDGRPLPAFDPVSLRRQLGVVHQSPSLPGETIRDVMLLAEPGASDGRVRAAIEAAGLRADVEALPAGYETRLRDGASRLSGGQRQRLAVARALLRRAPVLILDEVTSALDARTARHVLTAIAGLQSTRIMITHRLAEASRADRIVVLEDGRVAEIGTHAALMERDGLYAALMRAQQGRGDPPRLRATSGR